MYWEAHFVHYTRQRKLNTAYSITVIQWLTDGTVMIKLTSVLAAVYLANS